jgi:hypothetical protein
VDSYTAVDQSFARLHAAGWSVDDVRLLTAEGPCWLVSGTNGENASEVRAPTVEVSSDTGSHPSE